MTTRPEDFINTLAEAYPELKVGMTPAARFHLACHGEW